MRERGLHLDYTAIYRWLQQSAPTFMISLPDCLQNPQLESFHTAMFSTGIDRKEKRKRVVVIFSRYSCTLFKNVSALRKEIRMTILTTLETLFTRCRGCVIAPVRRWR